MVDRAVCTCETRPLSFLTLQLLYKMVSVSRQTASERIETLYTTNGEWDRIVREKKEEQQADLLFELKTAKANKTEGNQVTVEEGVKA